MTSSPSDALSYGATCGTAQNSSSCYLENVMGAGTNYGNAFWAINYFSVFGSSSNVKGTITTGVAAATVSAVGSGYGARTGSAAVNAATGSPSGSATPKSASSIIIAPIALLFSALVATLALA